MRANGTPGDILRDRMADARARAIACLRHDIRQPLQVLAMGLRTLRGSLSDASALALLGAVEKANYEVADTLRDLLDLLLLDLDEPPGARERVVLDTVFDALTGIHALRASEAKARLRIAPTRVALDTERRLLTRLLSNLVANATAHSGCTRILVGARLRDGVCTISVIDNGRGMPEGQAARLVAADPAPRVESRDERGLGLYIVRRFAELLGAEIDVQISPARGTAIHLRLPGPTERRPRRLRMPAGASRPLSGRVVALLDDQRDVLDSMRSAFESLGASVVAADDDLLFISEVMQLPALPDLFVIDLMLGRTTAERCLRILWSRFGRERVKVAIVTGHPERVAAMDLGPLLVLEKPLNEAAFESLIRFMSA
jgi:CheY-like chemotaxis protein/anti-sigma regulatory factor (Ser/Thr protein kinase)